MNTLISLDIETACGIGCTERCDHALDEHRNRITIIGAYYEKQGKPHAVTFRTVDELAKHLDSVGPHSFVGHNFKFDLKTLKTKGIDLSYGWEDDTLLMAATLTEKITEEWLGWYEGKRKHLNASLPRGYSHRQASAHSLKCLAPYFLGVEPFWENPTNHDNVEYVLQDCFYTYELRKVLEAKLANENGLSFYRDKLLPWTKNLLHSEQRGISLDLELLEQSDKLAKEAAQAAKLQLDVLWADAHKQYHLNKKEELRNEFLEKTEKAIQRHQASRACRRTNCAGCERTKARYRQLEERSEGKLENQVNLDSPKQLSWLLKDYYKLDITDFSGEEGTGKAILNKLAATRDDIKVFLEYRKQQKLTSAFFPSYREMQHAGAIHCSFNPTGTRTGRLSSSNPNLQQVPGHLHKLFKARPGYKLATYDMSAIEPRLIAFHTQDLRLVDIVNTGQDFHGYNTKIFFGLDCDVSEVKEKFPTERKMAKEVGLSLFYGAGTGRLRETAQKYGYNWSQKQCSDTLNRFKEFYEDVYKYRDEFLNPILMAGHPVTNLLGRQFRIDDPTNVHMQGFNTLIQSGASDLVLNSAARISRTFKDNGIDGHVLLLVHDELVIEVPAHQEKECVSIITNAMTAYDLPTGIGNVKLEVEGKVADRWEK